MATESNFSKDKRIEKILELLVNYSKFDFSVRQEISAKSDEIDAITLGLNTLGEEMTSLGVIDPDYQARFGELLNSIFKLTQSDYTYRVEISDKGDYLDAIGAGLNTLAEELEFSGKTIKNYESRINSILEILLGYTMMDFSQKAEVTETGDELDAISLGLNTLSEELESNISQLKEREDFIQTIINNAPDAVIVIDEKNFIKEWNHKAEKIFGWDKTEVIGELVYEKIIPIHYRESYLNAVNQYLSPKDAQASKSLELPALRKDNSVFDADLTISPFTYQNRQLFVGFIRDITQQKEAQEKIRQQAWLLTGASQLNEVTRGEKEVKSLAQDIINHLASYLESMVGAIYLNEENDKLSFAAGYAYKKPLKDSQYIEFGEGLVGQAAAQKKTILFDAVPDNYIKINSALGEVSPKNIIVSPFIHGRLVKGVIELGSLKPFTELQMKYFDLAAENIAIAIHTAQAAEKMKSLLEKSQQQSEELESQQEELKQINEDLMGQSKLLQSSEEELRVQQEELQQSNTELEEKAQLLKEKNEDLEQAKEAISLKIKEIELSSKYKSEFLANMSHEVRTPLNSVLILARLLAENKSKNLDEKQIEYANIIFKSGNDLLNLINDILDLSKIEAGKVDLNYEKISLENIENDIWHLFEEVANEKGIGFQINCSLKNEKILTDRVRIEQVLRNLLSNAFKFTAKGGNVTFTIKPAEKNIRYSKTELYNSSQVIEFSVRDSGIGIPKDKQKLIFEAFQQADGSTSRKYGGTGLGLSISRELSNILGGEIHISSEEGKGSTFTLYLPQEGTLEIKYEAKDDIKDGNELNLPITVPENNDYLSNEVPDDRKDIGLHDNVILIIEDDRNFAKILREFANERSYKAIIAVQGDTGLAYAKKYLPKAIILDMHLPELDGWSVLKSLKKDSQLKQIPVHIISAIDKKKLGLEMGAITYLKKPVQEKELSKAFEEIEKSLLNSIKNILIIEDDLQQSKSIIHLINSREKNVNCIPALSGKEALEKLKQTIDCIIIDLGLKDISGFDLIQKIRANESTENVPIIVYTGRELTKEEEIQLKKYSNAIILKTAKSYERLIDETALFLHKVEDKKTERLSLSASSLNMEELLSGKKVLLVDDDMRNVYALTSVLEQQGVTTIAATDGKDAIAKLKANKGIDLILMDIMMPEMDGYEAIREIRKDIKYKNLPILALTAKAMQGDREKCLKAGASDYISKPININQLISLMRVWLYK